MPEIYYDPYDFEIDADPQVVGRLFVARAGSSARDGSLPIELAQRDATRRAHPAKQPLDRLGDPLIAVRRLVVDLVREDRLDPELTAEELGPASDESAEIRLVDVAASLVDADRAEPIEAREEVERPLVEA